MGGGHNSLVAAAYLARAGRRVMLLEAADRLGGAVASGYPFPGVDARLSRFSYLVSLLPQRLIDELGLDLELASRTIASYTPVGDRGLLIERTPGRAIDASFTAWSAADHAAWPAFESRLATFAALMAPTLMDPFPGRPTCGRGWNRSCGGAWSSDRSASWSKTPSSTTPSAVWCSPTR